MKRPLLISLLLLIFTLYGCGNDATSVTNKEISNMQPDCEIALINTYLQDIQAASDNFYSEYFTISPTVAYYYVSVKKVTSDNVTNPTSLITFISMPFIGPHDPVGVDEISFLADYTGNIKLKEFKHIKSYSLPDNLESLLKKLIPGEYEKL